MMFNMDNNPLWNNRQKVANRPASSDFFNKKQGTVKYYSGIDAEIYFEGLFIDDIIQINFSMQQNTMPLFGYNSYVYDELAVGSRLINGQFAINFTQAEYMYKIIEELSDIYKDSKSNDLIADRKKRPLLNKTFNIAINYGKNSNNSFQSNPGVTQLYLTGVQLTGCNQQLDISGNPIYETYSFIAQDIMPSLPSSKKESETKSVKNPQTVISEENEDNKINIEYAEYSEELDNTRGSNYHIGKIKLSLDTNLDVKEISLSLKIKTMSSQAAKVISVSNIKNIVYEVDQTLKRDIDKYFKTKNVMQADFVANYYKDGKMCVAQLKVIDIKLKKIINK